VLIYSPESRKKTNLVIQDYYINRAAYGASIPPPHFFLYSQLQKKNAQTHTHQKITVQFRLLENDPKMQNSNVKITLIWLKPFQSLLLIISPTYSGFLQVHDKLPFMKENPLFSRKAEKTPTHTYTRKLR